MVASSFLARLSLPGMEQMDPQVPMERMAQTERRRRDRAERVRVVVPAVGTAAQLAHAARAETLDSRSTVVAPRARLALWVRVRPQAAEVVEGVQATRARAAVAPLPPASVRRAVMARQEEMVHRRLVVESAHSLREHPASCPVVASTGSQASPVVAVVAVVAVAPTTTEGAVVAVPAARAPAEAPAVAGVQAVAEATVAAAVKAAAPPSESTCTPRPCP